MIRLSVLDQSPIRSGGTAAQALQETLLLAQAAERLGYRRYWVAEHHNSGGLAGTSPEILVGQIAARTRSLRVGSGGVMLSHYSAYKVAENFRLLEALYPGRIDLGIGRAPGSDRLTAAALAPGQSGFGYEDYPRKVADLMGYLTDSLPPEHPFARLRAMPDGPTVPELWMLGSSDESAMMAAHFGRPFSFAHFINQYGGPQVMAMYRANFRPSKQLAGPLGSIGVFVMCAETEEEAIHHASSRPLWMLRNRRGERKGVPPPEEAKAYPWSGAERAFAEDVWGRTTVGDPDQCKAGMLQLAGAYGVEELVVVTVCHSFEARVRSYELLAQAFGLEGRG
ncbi:MAG: LLM class flavin-dependent oxidoreductase [Candidatus Tectomicrobia bacterium]|uniref:Luciferase-like monooxygenase n=1 Tax=Tectimicrobiota bacterium TaxID=2528274 RepID=A0A932MM95_UNCTE|nr:LLM class flavin-dependent oxidoreductase [Candidatus Tectomicrobia bacterium]